MWWREYETSKRILGGSLPADSHYVAIWEADGQRIESDPDFPSQRPPRRYRTRPDPFAEVWQTELVELLEASPHLRATAVFEELQRRLWAAPGSPADARLEALLPAMLDEREGQIFVKGAAPRRRSVIRWQPGSMS